MSGLSISLRFSQLRKRTFELAVIARYSLKYRLLGILLLATTASFLSLSGIVSAQSDYTYSGTLTDSAGQAVKFMTIDLNAADGNAGSTSTAADGSFSLTVPADTYGLRLVCDGTDEIDYHLTSCNFGQSGHTINLASGNVSQNLQLETATIQVTVKNASGATVSGAPVTAKSEATGGGTTDLYSGDPGETIYGADTGTNSDLSTNGSGVANVTTLVGENFGTSYSAGSICANVSGGYVCNASPITVTGDTSITLTAPASYTFSGTLTDNAGQAVKYMTIKLSNNDGNSGTTTTAADGSFSLTVPEDTYALSVNCPGPSDAIDYHFDTCYLSQTGTPTINLTSANVSKNLQLETATIQVTVKNSNGTAVNGAAVSARYEFSGGGTTSLYTGDPGEAINSAYTGNNSDSFSNSSGIANLTTLVGENFGTSYSAGSICASVSGGYVCNASPITVTGDASITLTVPPPSYTYSGTLTDSAGQAVKFMTIDLNAADGNAGSTSTAADGSFSLTVPADTYGLRLVCDGTDEIDYHLTSCNFGQSGHTINLASGNVSQNLQLETATIQVTVKNASGATVSGAPVTAKSEATGGGTTDLYSGDPGETIYGADTGTNSDLSTNGSGVANVTTLVGENFGTSYSAGSICANVSGGYVCNASPITVTGDTSIVLQQAPVTHTFSGTLTDGSGTALSNLTVKLTASDGNTAHAVTDTNGHFSMTATQDQYMLSVDNYSGTQLIQHVVGNINTLLLSQTNAAINLTTGDVTQNLELNLSTIHVTVKDAGGSTVPNAAVTAYEQVRNASGSTGTTSLYTGDPGENNSQTYYQSITTDANGNAGVTSVTGLIFGAGAGDTNDPNYSYLCATIAGSQVCLPAPLTVTGNTNVVLQQAPVTHTFSGTLTDGSGTALSNLTVKLTASDGNTAHAVTDTNGHFSMTATQDQYMLSVDNYSGTQLIQHVVGNINTLLLSQTNAAINLTTGDVTQNLELNLSTIHVTVKDAGGSTVPNAAVTAYEQVRNASGSTGTTSLYTGDPGENNSQTYYQSITTDANGNAGVTSVTGLIFGAGAGDTNDPNYSYLCATIAGSQVCLPAPLTVTGNTNVVLQPTPSITAPTNLAIPSPAQIPVLSWTAVTSATSYNIYRDGTKIDSSSTNSYTDNSAPEGTDSYYVTAVNSGGESSASNTVSVLVDRTDPSITYTITPIADSNGNNTGNVLVTFTCTDNTGGSGIASCTSPVTVSDEGIGQIVAGTATDNAGNTAMINANASLLVSAISAGGNGAIPFSADTGFTGGTAYGTTATVDTSNVLNPAPQSVYQNSRYGNTFSYTFPGLTPGAAYTLRLDFNELYFGAQAGGGIGSRVFNVGVNGTPALTNFDIYDAAGGANKAIAEQFSTTADSNGNVTVTFTADTDNALVNGLELFNGTLPPIPPQPTVTSAHIAAGSSSDIAPFTADTDFSGGQPYSSTASVDTSGVTNPAPQAVYQNVRYGNFSYLVPHLAPNTTYNVRLDFNELYWGVNGNGGTGSRIFNVAINGTQVLNNFDVYATAGGANKAIAENFTATSDAYGNITINFTGVTDNAMVSGIEISQ